MPIDTRTSAHQRGYDATWRRLRAWHLAQHPLCRYCEQLGRTTAATVVDHIDPFRGPRDPRRLDPANLQSLCKPCHDSVKQAQDRGAMLRGCDVSGVPLDATHHWRA